MKIIEIKVYPFDELPPDIQQKVLSNLFDINVDHEWWDGTYEDAKNIGLKITSFDLERNRHAKGEFMYSAVEVAANILKEHGETCETYKTAEAFLDDYNVVFADYTDENSENYESRELEDQMQDLESDFLESLLEDYSIMLQNECEYLQSEEAVKETIEANEYTFTIEGKMMNS